MKKGQFTIVAMVMTFISIIVFIVLYPTLNTFITAFINESNDPTLNMVVQLMPFFMLLAIIMGFLWYVIPQRQTTTGYG